MDKNTLSHTSWRCKYHIVFAPKYRRQVIYRQIRKDIGSILRELCSRKGINIIEAELCWCRGYYVDTVGRNEKKIKEYIQNQLKEDYYTDQISIKEYYDPFTGESVNKNK